MTSKIKVDNINKVSDDSNIIKKCGTTTTIGSGASNPIVVDGSAVTLGRCGGTVALASGATQTGFGRTGTVDWQTGSIKTSTFTAANGEGYFVNTTGGAVTTNLPAGTAGAIVAFKDYAGTFDTNNLILAANGSDKIGGSSDNQRLNIAGVAITLVFIDSTKGWLVTEDGLQSKIIDLTYSADFLVIAGGAGGVSTCGGSGYGGGAGGAGGYRASFNCETSGGGGSSETPIGLLDGVTYTVTVGGGGARSPDGNSAAGTGTPSSLSGPNITTITSLGGGGMIGSPTYAGGPGGSGGGANGDGPSVTGGSGTANQGFPGGGKGTSPYGGGGGGGAGSAGSNGGPGQGGPGGNGVASTITGSPVTRGGGGGGGGNSGGSAGPGGGGVGTNASTAGSGTVNTGGGAGGTDDSAQGGAGGSGIVIVRMATSNYSGTQTGGTVTTSGSDTIITFNGNGSFEG